jgi:MscS family membrane protein
MPLRKMRDRNPKHRVKFGLRLSNIFSKLSRCLIGFVLASLTGANFAPVKAQILPSKPAPVASPAAAPSDPQGLGRETPRGTVIGFIRAAQAENYDLAIQYFEPRRRSASSDDQELAAQLLAILNSRFPSTDSVTDDPEGRVGDGVPRTQITVGLTRTMVESFPLSLVRLDLSRGVKLWFISRQTLERVPEIYYSLRYPQIEKRLPRFLVQTRPLEMPLWQWLAIVLLAPIAFALGWLAVFLALAVWQFVRRARGLPADPLRPLRRFGPETLLAAAIIHYNLVSWIGTSLLYRQYYRDIIWIFVAFGIYWAATRIIYRISVLVWTRLTEKGRLAERSLISLGRRFLDVLLFVLIGLIVLRSMGLDVTAALAGLGIGGLAIGLGAQKTFENLLGGIAILTDRALVVGDPCKIGDRTGVVEDIGLRSTKLRTEDRTVVSIPNGTVATATLENYRLRDKILFRQVVRLRYDLSANHVRYTLGEIREILAHHPRVEEATWRVRVLRFADYSIDVEVYVYILDRDYLQFLAIQEQLLLQILEVIERTGATVAQPTQTTLVARDNWVDPEKAAAAQKAIEKNQDFGVPGPQRPELIPEKHGEK